jgi:hypothetical protein
MNDLRVDRIEEALGAVTGAVERLGAKMDSGFREVHTKVDGLAARMDEEFREVHAKVDGLAARMDEEFLEVRAAFVDQKEYTDFTFRHMAKELREEMKAGFNQLDRRFDRLEERLFKGR